MQNLQLKFLDGAPAGTFTGLASTPTKDRQNDIVLPGAFEATLADWQARGGMAAPLLWQHDQTQPIGIIHAATETADGLHVTGRIITTSPAAAHAYALAQAGSLSMSIGYTVPDGGAKMIGGVRHLSAVELHEVSLVSVPANADTRITSIKSAYDATTVREYEKFIRSALGLSQRDATAVAAKSWPLLHGERAAKHRDGGERNEAVTSQALAILQRSNPHL